MILISGWCSLIMVCFHICCHTFNPVSARSLHNIYKQFHTSLCHTHTRETHRLTVCTQWHTGVSRQCPLATRGVICGGGRVLRLDVYGCWFSAAVHCGCQLIHCCQRVTARPDTVECFWFVVVTLENEIRLFYCFRFSMMRWSDL